MQGIRGLLRATERKRGLLRATKKFHSFVRLAVAAPGWLEWKQLTMPRCVYCNQPTGFWRRRHAECQERHTRALAMIPELFTRALHSTLPVTRFGELLKDAADASFIKPREFEALCIQGISSMIDAVLVERLLTTAEEERITEIKNALSPSLADMAELNEKLIKIAILREINVGQIPDRVTIVGPMPIELRRHEHVIWVFNHAICFHRLAPAAPAFSGAIAFPATETDFYCGLRAFDKDPLPMKELVEEATGDLVLTDRNIYFIFGDGQRRIPMAKITALQPRADGIQITCDESQARSRTFKLDDPWLAANLIVGLVKIVQKERRPA